MSTRAITPPVWTLKQDALRIGKLNQRRRNGYSIPPELRITVAGHSKHCSDCTRFTRNGGGCPGVVSSRPQPPMCMEHFDGRLQCPVTAGPDGHLRLIPGQEKFYEASAPMTAQEFLAGLGVRGNA